MAMLLTRLCRRVAMSAAAMSMSLSTATMSAACASTAPFVVATDGVAAPSMESSKEFLLSRPPGAYTTARTCSGARRLFEWETHVSRTASSVAAMLGEQCSGRASPLFSSLATAEALRPRLDATVAAAVKQYLVQHDDVDELKVTVLVTWDQTAAASTSDEPLGSIACHVAPLPRLPEPPVRVEVRGAPRTNAAAKDSTWVTERAPLEALMRASAAGDLNELLLKTEGGELLEGSQTNFFALIDGQVHTAADGVLAGTVRRLLLEVCERDGIPVVLEPPRLEDAHKWEGAFISSTSRLLLPIDELYVPREGEPSQPSDRRMRFENLAGSLAARLRDAVRQEVEAHSSMIAL